MPTSPEAPNGSKFITRTPLDFLLAAVDCCDNGSDLKISCRVDFSTKIGSKSGTKSIFNSTSTNSRPPDAAAVWMVSPGQFPRILSPRKWVCGQIDAVGSWYHLMLPFRGERRKKTKIGRQKRRLDRPGHAVWRPSTQSQLINTTYSDLGGSTTFLPHPRIT